MRIRQMRLLGRKHRSLGSRTKLFMLVWIGWFFTPLSAQETTLHTDPFFHYKEGINLYEEKVYGPAQQSMQVFLSSLPSTPIDDQERYKLQAEQIIALSGLHLSQTGGEKELIDFVHFNDPDPLIQKPLYELGNYYFQLKRYSQSLEYFTRVDQSVLSDVQQSEISYKIGYGHFVQKKFPEAISAFTPVRNIRNVYYAPINYYYGMSQYFTNDYDGAITSFEKVSAYPRYQPLIPYYVTQIYFNQKQYDQLIEYGEKSIQNPSVRNLKDIRLILGQTYFEKGDYGLSLPHLKYYESNTSQLTKEEFFQLAFSYYRTKQYREAIPHFKEISILNDRLGQLSHYYLADCFLRTDDLASARSAFKKVSEMPFEEDLQDEALFNYGKLSSQLNFDREAINALVKMPKGSSFYTESRMIVNDLLLRSGDYANSVAIIESLDDLSDDLKGTYQKAAFNRGVQLLYEKKLQGARFFFTKANQYSMSPIIGAQIAFWEAYMLHQEKKYSESSLAFSEWLKTKNKTGNLPLETSEALSSYYQGYNLLKLRNYREGAIHFTKSYSWLMKNQSNIADPLYSERIRLDAALRAGDCHFKENNYQQAKELYQNVASSTASEAAYALYQTAIIQGLQSQPSEKILTLRRILEDHEESAYLDDALYQSGEAYTEMGRLSDAGRAYQKLINQFGQQSPYTGSANNRLGLIAYNAGDYKRALEYYKATFKNSPSAEEARAALIAIEEIYIQDLSDADAYVIFANTIPGMQISKIQRDSLSYISAESLYERQEYEKAISAFENYIREFPSGLYITNALFNRAESYSVQKNYGKALEDYLQLVDMGETQFLKDATKKSAILSYNYAEDYKNASLNYMKWDSLATDPLDRYEAQVGAMRANFRIGDYKNTVKYANLLLNNEMVSDTDKSQAYFLLGKSSLAMEQAEQALVAFKQISSGRNSESAEGNFRIAQIYFQQNKIDLAEQQINYNLENHTNYPSWIAESLLLYADIYMQRGDLLNARAAVEAVKENFELDVNNKIRVDEKLNIITQREESKSRIKSTDSTSVELDTINGND